MKDCTAECLDAPLDREMKSQVGAFSASSAALSGLAATGRSPWVQGAAAAGGGILGFVFSYSLGRYVAQKKCETICAAFNAIERGEEIIVDEWLLAAFKWLESIIVRGETCKPGDTACVMYEKLVPYIVKAAKHLPSHDDDEGF